MARGSPRDRFDKKLPVVGGAHLAQRFVDQTRIPEAPSAPKPRAKPTRLLFSLISLFLSVLSFMGYILVSLLAAFLIRQHPEWMQSTNAMLGLSLLPLTGLALNFAGLGFGLSAWFQRDHRRSVVLIALGSNLFLLFAYSALTIIGAASQATGGN